MKKILLVLVFALMSGCALVDAYNMAKWDPVEYDKITTIRAHATQYANSCDDVNSSKIHADSIAFETQEFLMYSEHVRHNTDGYTAAKALDEIAQGVKNMYDKEARVSTMFCKLKFTGIANAANLMQHTIGGRPR